MDNELLSYAYLLQAGYTHKELKDLLIENTQPAALLWENTKKGVFPELSQGREEKIKMKLTFDETKIQNILEKNRVEIITKNDSRYPAELRTIGHSPSFLYVRGNLPGNIPLIGVVGSRKHSPYADRILEKILPDIIQAGVGIVSGGATGVDTLGHTICLKENGYTLVVLGTGIDVCYPFRNHTLFEKIIESGGGIISHFPLSLGPEQYNFPMRNELVAALSKGILIPEAGLSSGTLITAQLALEHGRDVFAVPGDIDRPTSEGTNMLIATGQAKCVRCSGDILEEYFELKGISVGMTPIIKSEPIFSNEHERCIFHMIETGINSADALLRETSYDMSELLIHIAMLEIGGHISLDEMGKYQIK